MAIDTVVRTFEGENKRILWLPSITLAYLFTLSGDKFQFVAAVIATGGAQWFRILINPEFTSRGSLPSAVGWLNKNYSFGEMSILSVLSVIYAGIAGYAIWKLYRYFTHQDLVLVGLGVIWCGIGIVVLVNLVGAVNIDSGN
ncbi:MULTISPECIES: hypothetical protein [Halorubrum]|uniref:hypothetical protein n=1 Tax=Halorubrum TaxID=56688 RepID=UPI00126721FF|nr:MULTISPECIES: hypothetical protein [Halorubrum]